MAEFAPYNPIAQSDLPAATLAPTDPLTVTPTKTPIESLPVPIVTPTPDASDPLSPTSTTEPTPVEPAPDETTPTPAWPILGPATQASFQAEPTDEQAVSASDHPILPPLTLQLSAEAEPRRVTPGDPLIYHVSAIHTGQEPLRDITIKGSLPVGLVFIAEDTTDFEYDAPTETLTWRVAELQPGSVSTGTFQVRAQGAATGDVITNTLSASGATYDGTALGGVVVDVTPPRATDSAAVVTADQGGWLVSADARIEIQVPPGAVGNRAKWSHLVGAGGGHLKLPEGSRYSFTLSATNEDGTIVTSSRAPFKIVYPLTAEELKQHADTSFGIFMWDPDALAWQAVPAQIDTVHRTLIASTDSMTTFAVVAMAASGGNSASYQYDPGSRIKGARPQLYSGSISYSYDFDIPPGRGGLTPMLALNYSSSRHQRESGHFNFAGHGWDILGENYASKADPEHPESSALNVVLNGATYTLNTSNPWFVKEDPFVQTWEYVTPCMNGSCPGWLGLSYFPYYRLRLRTADGTRYTFQGIAMVSSAAPITANEPPMTYRWRDNTCNPATGGQWPDLVRLPLVEVLDVNGNKLTYNWEATASNAAARFGADDTWQEDHNCNYVRTVRLKDIRYNFNGSGVEQNLIQLRYDNAENPNNLRYDRPNYFPAKAMSLYAIYKLLGVDIQVRDDAGLLRTVRSYNLNYYDQCAGGCGDKGASLLLPSQIQDAAPGATALTTTFNYDNNKEITTQCDFGYLIKTTGPFGGEVSFTAAKQAVDCGNPRPPMVGTHKVKDLVTGQEFTWDYWMTGWNQKAHGYAQVNVLNPDLGDNTRRLEQHFFLQMTTLGSTEIDHLAGREYRAIACLPQSNTPSSACQTELSRTDTTWGHSTNDLPLDPVYIYLPADQQPRFVYVDVSDQWQETQPILRTRSYYETARQGGKQYGNLTAKQDYSATGTSWVSTPDRTAYYTYYPTTVYWILNKVATSELFKYCSGCANGSRESKTKYYYDGATSETTPPTLGRLTKQTDGYGSTEATTQYTYWSNGNPRQVIDPLNRTTETFYDSRFQAYPVCAKNALGQITKQRYYGVPGSGDANCSAAPGDSGDPVWPGTTPYTTPTTGRFFGELEDETDANNIVTGSYRWDAEGRITKVIQPGDDDTNPTLKFSYTAYAGVNQPFWLKQEQRDNAPGAAASYLETRTFYDGLGQVIQTQSEGANSSQSVVVSTQYNAEGQPVKKNAPYFGAGLTTFQTPDFTKPTTQMIYDALGRVKKVLAPDGTTYTEHAYAVAYNAGDGDFTTPRPIDYTIDANRRFVRRAYDAFGNLRIVSEATGSWPEGGAPDWGTELRTRYTYDVEGQLTQVQDHLGNITSLTYDDLGRKASLNDRDMGLWSYGYDAVGNLTRQTDAKNQTTCLYYDALNRITGKMYQAVTSCPATRPAIVATGYTYDTGSNGIGRRASMTVYQSNSANADNSASWTYDTRGRVTSETRTVDGVNYVEDMSYDAASRVATLRYPPEVGGTREAISNNYDTAGQLTQVRSTTYSLNYASGITYTSAGQLAEIIYGRLDGQQNGTTERRGYYGSGGNWDVKPTTGLRNYGNLWRVRLTNNTNNVALFDQAWNYDLAGNVTRSNEAVTGAGSAWPNTYSFQDAFNSKNTSAYTWSSYQTVPYNDAGNNVVKSTGTGSSYDANFYRTSTLTTGNGIQLRFKVDATNTSAHFAIETADGTKRLCVRADNGMLQLQYNDGGGFRYPADLVKNVTLNTWYVVRIVIDDTRGSYVEVYPESDPSKRAAYQQYLPTGQAWRFHHWIYRGTAYIDDYREFNTSSMTWLPDERVGYGYDALKRLTSAAPESGANGFSQSYQYDVIGNLTYRSDVGTYTYPASGPTSVRPHAATSIGANYSYAYDANGNMTTRREGAVTYTQTWDEENRLKTISTTGHTVTYTYDADGQRVKKVEDGQTTIYIGNSYEKNVTANTVTTYYYAGSQRVAQRQAGVVSYFVGDNLGSTSLTTDSSGAEVGRQKYYPFGSPRVQTGTLKTDYRFTGQRSEEANFGSLYDYGARFYSPVLGRFLSPDTIIPAPSNPQSFNRYSYVRNSPLRLIDPSGMAECAADDRACWENEWYWNNRWYQAHGYGWGGNHWDQVIDAKFADPGIFNDVMMDAGINIVWSWSTPNVVTWIGQGIVRFGQALAGGLPQLKKLLGGGATIKNGSLFGHPYAPPWFDNTVYIPEATDAQWVRQTVAHELAHVIDWHNNFSGAWAKQNGALTEYAAGFHPYPAIWEVWAEAVKVWVFGSKDQNSGAWSSSISLRSGMDQYLTVQMDRLTALLGGSR